MEKRRLLSYLPPRLQSIPILGGIVAGYLTLLVVIAESILPTLPMFSGEGSLILFPIVFPLTLSGMVFVAIICKLTGGTLETHPLVASLSVSIVSIILNAVLVWSALTSLGAICRVFRGRKSKDYVK